MVVQTFEVASEARSFVNYAASLLLRRGDVSASHVIPVRRRGVWDDIFSNGHKKSDGLTGPSLFESAPPKEWALMTGALGALCMVDVFLIRKIPTRFANVLVVCMWVFASICYGIHYSLQYGKALGLEWFLGYVLEIVLSIDNVFVFHLIFETFRPPPRQQDKAMYFGIAGALIARLVMFFALGHIVHAIHWVRCGFGLILIYSGMQAVKDEDEDEDPADSTIMRGLRSCLGSRLMTTYDDRGRMFVRGEDGRMKATMLVPLIACVEATDVLFAADSLSAKVTQIHNQFVAFSSSAFAILALRALFFVLRDLVDYFEYLKYGLCIILIFIGIELLVADFVQFPPSALLFVILSVFTVAIGSSVQKKLKEERMERRRSSLASANGDAVQSSANPNTSAETGGTDATGGTEERASSKSNNEPAKSSGEPEKQTF
eukprot:TRINITY_DN4732_c0_g1_i1.p1 TRINITY_DN4732_c0_g1~~TRINITY_DN4732_c0_g1_i1.p1  ORF type:complete len:432 (+),score=101.95 TRINITY_DN4732_c0_g1_i1:197-1492(+)